MTPFELVWVIFSIDANPTARLQQYHATDRVAATPIVRRSNFNEAIVGVIFRGCHVVKLQKLASGGPTDDICMDSLPRTLAANGQHQNQGAPRR